MKGKLIVFEGVDFAGKSTCIEQSKTDFSNCIFTKEPGSNLNGEHTKMCNDIRHILLTEKQDINAERLLFATSRYLHTLDMIKELENGNDVICDRYFISSLAYQGTAKDTKDIYMFNKSAIKLLIKGGYEVHTIIVSIDYDTYVNRSSYRELDAMEIVDEDVIKRRIDRLKNITLDLNCLNLYDWGKRIHYVNGNQSKEEVYEEAKTILNKIIG